MRRAAATQLRCSRALTKESGRLVVPPAASLVVAAGSLAAPAAAWRCGAAGRASGWVSTACEAIGCLSRRCASKSTQRTHRRSARIAHALNTRHCGVRVREHRQPKRTMSGPSSAAATATTAASASSETRRRMTMAHRRCAGSSLARPLRTARQSRGWARLRSGAAPALRPPSASLAHPRVGAAEASHSGSNGQHPRAACVTLAIGTARTSSLATRRPHASERATGISVMALRRAQLRAAVHGCRSQRSFDS
jgi:hypothetical protein